MELKKQDEIGVWVKASEELPEVGYLLSLRIDGITNIGNYWTKDTKRIKVSNGYEYSEKDFHRIEWLKPFEGYVLTEDELLEFAEIELSKHYTPVTRMEKLCFKYGWKAKEAVTNPTHRYNSKQK